MSERRPKSSGSESTYAKDLTDLGEIRREITAMAEDAATWLERRHTLARTVTIKVRYQDFTTITRSHTEEPTREEERIVRRAVSLLDKTEAGRRPVRLLGVSVHNLCSTLTPVTIDPQPMLPFEGGPDKVRPTQSTL